jgi:hypothetical protein
MTMNSKWIVLLLSMLLVVGMWNCEDVPSTGVGPGAGTIRIQGTVRDSVSVLENAVVGLLFDNKVDSVYTTNLGQFEFEVDLAKVQNSSAYLSAWKKGYSSRIMQFTLGIDTTFEVVLRVDLSTSALIAGVVRDSLTGYPLRQTSVLLSLPGLVDSTVTPIDGSFRITADLVDRDSLPISLTLYKAGYKNKRLDIMVYKGQTTQLGDILMTVDAGSTVAQVLGRVFDAQNRLPITNATIILTSNILVDSVRSSVSGDFSFSIDLHGLPSVSGSLELTKTGYKAQDYSFTVQAGKALSGDFYLVRDTTTGIRDSNGTGTAHAIAFISMTAQEIAVYGVGGMESSILLWEVRDSLGFPIDIDHADTVEFELSGTPTLGGAYVSPARAITNVSGRVATTVNSGTVSGVLQFKARMRRDTDGHVIESAPVIITVNAGLPDQAHFSVASALLNFPAYDWLGRVDAITVQSGDKYSNPVKTNTAVYFNTTGGVINASGFTDKNGQAVVDLHSGNPRPNDVGRLGIGFARIAATTMGESSVTVSDTIVVLFSATAQIDSVSAATFRVPGGGASPPINFRVSDRFGNPLAAGTEISVSLQYTPPPNSQLNLVVTGDVSITLGDTQSRGWGTTWFSFQVVDQTYGGLGSAIPVTAVIKVTSPNGNPPNWSISGTVGG